jgi:hypothetical protein
VYIASGKTDRVDFSQAPKLYASRFQSCFRCVFFFQKARDSWGRWLNFLSVLSYSRFFVHLFEKFVHCEKRNLFQDPKMLTLISSVELCNTLSIPHVFQYENGKC